MNKLKKCVLIGLGIILSLHSYGGKQQFITHVTITTYNAVRSQCDRSPLITADGTKIDHNKVKSGEQKIVAISRDLLYAIPLGSSIDIVKVMVDTKLEILWIVGLIIVLIYYNILQKRTSKRIILK